MKKGPLIICGLLSLLFFACQVDHPNTPTTLIEQRLFQLGKDSWKSRQVAHQVGEIQYRATEVPLEYYLLKQEGNKDLLHIDSLAQAHRNERIVEFEFEHIGREDLLLAKHTSLNYDESVRYLASKIQDDFYAVTTARDTITCRGVHFERHFSISPFQRVLLYFGDVDPTQNLELHYRDRLYQQGDLEFDFGEIPFKS